MGDDEEEKAAKPGASLTKAAKAASILAFARKLTGKQSVDAVMGAMQAMADTHRRGGKLAAEVATLKADAQAAKISSLIATGMKAGKLAPSQKAWARSQSPASLQAYLDAAPKMVHTVEDEHTEAKVEGAQNGSVTAAMAKIWSKQGFAEKDFPALLAKMNGTTTMNGAS
jgi:phage I-like protein